MSASGSLACQNTVAPDPLPASAQGITGSRCRRWLLIVCAVFCLAAVFRVYFRFAVTVGESMLPTLRSGEVLLVNRRAYLKEEPRRGDIVVARYHGELVVKRVVGFPGEVLELVRGKLLINGIPFREHYPVKSGLLSVSRGKLLEGRYALLGDNRGTSLSTIAIVSQADMLGKVIWPAPRP